MRKGCRGGEGGEEREGRASKMKRVFRRSISSLFMVFVDEITHRSVLSTVFHGGEINIKNASW